MRRSCATLSPEEVDQLTPVQLTNLVNRAFGQRSIDLRQKDRLLALTRSDGPEYGREDALAEKDVLPAIRAFPGAEALKIVWQSKPENFKSPESNDITQPLPQPTEWTCRIVNPTRSLKGLEVHGDTLAEVICRAYLLFCAWA